MMCLKQYYVITILAWGMASEQLYQTVMSLHMSFVGRMVSQSVGRAQVLAVMKNAKMENAVGEQDDIASIQRQVSAD